jgi:uncharacterized membrane protein
MSGCSWKKPSDPRPWWPLSIVAGFFLFVLASFLLYETRYKDIIGKLWLAAASVIVSYIALDVIAGFLLIQPLSAPLVPDEYRHHKFVPNSYSKFQ